MDGAGRNLQCRPKTVVLCKRIQASKLAGGRVAHVVETCGAARNDEEAVEGGVELEVLCARIGAPDHGRELVIRRVTAEGDETGVVGGFNIGFTAEQNVVDDGEQGLAAVVLEHEVVGGGGAAPRPADGAAAEDILGRQPQEYLFDHDSLGQVVEDGGAASVRHGEMGRWCSAQST